MSESDEQIRKVYVKDLKAGEKLHTVFKAQAKEKRASRNGKGFLALTLVDRTGQVDGRVFENVEAADGAFAVGDYLLLEGRTDTFHNKLQVIVDKMERLDPGPIDAKEFDFVAPPPPSAPPAPVREAREQATREAPEPEPEGLSHKAARQRLLRLLDNPQMTHALDLLVRHFESYIDERIALKLGQQPVKAERERKVKAPRVDHRPLPTKGDGAEAKATEHKHERHEPKRDPSLPTGLAFKPLDQLIPAPASPEASPEPTQG